MYVHLVHPYHVRAIDSITLQLLETKQPYGELSTPK